VQMGKLNKDALIGLAFWLAYGEFIAGVIYFGSGINFWILQPFVILVTLLMFGLTYGSQTKADHEKDWYSNDDD